MKEHPDNSDPKGKDGPVSYNWETFLKRVEEIKARKNHHRSSHLDIRGETPDSYQNSAKGNLSTHGKSSLDLLPSSENTYSSNQRKELLRKRLKELKETQTNTTSTSEQNEGKKENQRIEYVEDQKNQNQDTGSMDNDNEIIDNDSSTITLEGAREEEGKTKIPKEYIDLMVNLVRNGTSCPRIHPEDLLSLESHTRKWAVQ